MVSPTLHRLLLLASGGCLLAGCPQLRSDDFRGVPATSAGAGGQGGSGGAAQESDASADSSSGGSGGTVPPDAPDVSSAASALGRALAHRYSFDGSGTTAVDSRASADGYIYDASLDGRGFVHLAGSGEFVSLPDGLLSSSNDKTLEAWLIWRGGDRWQRIFDFGISDAGEQRRGNGQSYLCLTTTSDSGAMEVAYTRSGYVGEVRLYGAQAFPVGVLTHVAVTIDSSRDSLSLYLDGALHAATPLTQRLSDITDLNVWIGLSQYFADPSLDADVTEFRIYDAALDADLVAESYGLGPDANLPGAP